MTSDADQPKKHRSPLVRPAHSSQNIDTRHESEDLKARALDQVRARPQGGDNEIVPSSDPEERLQESIDVLNAIRLSIPRLECCKSDFDPDEWPVSDSSLTESQVFERVDRDFDDICKKFPDFAAWYTNVYSAMPESELSDKASSPRCYIQSPSPPASPDSNHRKWLEDQDCHEYDDPWRSHDLEYYEMEKEMEAEPGYYEIETQPDVPEYYALPTAPSRQPDGPDAPWNRYVS